MKCKEVSSTLASQCGVSQLHYGQMLAHAQEALQNLDEDVMFRRAIGEILGCSGREIVRSLLYCFAHPVINRAPLLTRMCGGPTVGLADQLRPFVLTAAQRVELERSGHTAMSTRAVVSLYGVCMCVFVFVCFFGCACVLSWFVVRR